MSLPLSISDGPLTRRGSCPGIATPMQTGDGLLARVLPGTPISIHAFIELCAASERHGNGIIEVTQRGSIQLRGLTAASAPEFARVVIALGLGDESKPTIITPPLLGLDATETVDVRQLSAQLRQMLMNRAYVPSLAAKVSLLIDGDGALHLDQLAADIRLRAMSATEFHLAIGGTAHTAMNLGRIKAQQVASVVDELLARLAALGSTARARDLVSGRDLNALRASLASRVHEGAAPPQRAVAELIGRHELQGDGVALGIALAFGYNTADVLQKFAISASTLGAGFIQPAPDRALLIFGLTRHAADQLALIAAEAGFIVEPCDARRHVVACAGSPACASATLATRELASRIAQASRSWLDRSTTIHLSGCRKGCAHPRAADVTIVGPDRLVIAGRASDTPQARTAPANLISGFEGLSAELSAMRFDGEQSAALLTRIGSARMIEYLAAGTAQ